jgi:hypothetical protein
MNMRNLSYKGLQVIDVSDSRNPVIVGSVDTPGKAREVFVLRNYAYVAAYLVGLAVIDISGPTNPNGERSILHNAFTVKGKNIRPDSDID